LVINWGGWGKQGRRYPGNDESLLPDEYAEPGRVAVA